MPSIDDDIPQTTCRFTLFGQVEPARLPRAVLAEVEAENQTPTGVTIVHPPTMALRGMLLSAECGLLYTFDHMDGIR
jgi:hypothetical protein